jgi:DNA (cytosine-5)-methyltransferase 1
MPHEKTINAISLFSGTGMLDVGADRALERLGYKLRTVLYCEKDPFCQQIIRARIADGLLDDAPVWPDVSTLSGEGFRGNVGVVVFGFPCQPFSHAGKRAGTKDDRYLFGDAVRIALESGAPLIFCENVPGLLAPTTERGELLGESVGVSPDKFVCPAPIGDVLRILAEGGFDARWGSMGAEDVGAPHGRQRFWCIAWRRMADTDKK